MGKRVCVVCRQECSGGIHVEEDVVIATIRAIKQRLNLARGNELVVCPEHIAKAKEKRAAFEKRLMQHSAVAALFFFVMLIALRSFVAAAFGIAVAIFLLALALVSYFPAVNAGNDGEKDKRDAVGKG